MYFPSAFTARSSYSASPPPPPPPPALTSRPAPLLRASFRFPHKSLLIGRLYPLVFILSPPIPSPCIHKSCPRHHFGFLHKRLGLFPAPQAPRPCLARMPSVDPIILLYESYSPDLEESSSPRHNDLGWMWPLGSVSRQKALIFITRGAK